MKKRVKVAITGAAGQIGYALMFRIASGQMLGEDTEIDLHLLELEAALPGLHGTAMELQDCAFPLLKNVVCTSDTQTAFDGVNWALLVGASPRKAGMERSDLLKINGGIFRGQGEAINQKAASDVRILVVGNPCNTNCLIAMHHAPDVPSDRFYAMTLLDENRARAQLAMKSGRAVSDVRQMAIWGNHSSTQFPDYFHATIDHRPATEVIEDTQWLETQFISDVQQRGAAVIKARGASSAASAANAALNTVYNITHDTPKEDCHSVALCSRGEYGVDEGLIFSFPCRTEQHNLRVLTDWENNAFAKEKIALTLNELRQEKEAVAELGLL